MELAPHWIFRNRRRAAGQGWLWVCLLAVAVVIGGCQ